MATYDVERDVPAISGAVMLVRRRALELAGGVDDRWFMYFEDLDICARLAQAGWQIRYCPGATAIHDGALSSPRTPALETWLAVHLEAAVNLYLRVHRGPLSSFVHRGLVAVAGALWLAAALFSRPRGAGLGRGVGLLRWAITGAMPSSGRPA
jgi:GT2 family glycosyltransferase